MLIRPVYLDIIKRREEGKYHAMFPLLYITSAVVDPSAGKLHPQIKKLNGHSLFSKQTKITSQNKKRLNEYINFVTFVRCDMMVSSSPKMKGVLLHR